MIIAIICKTKEDAQQHIDTLQAKLRQGNFSQVSTRRVPASGKFNFELSALMATGGTKRTITFVGPDPLSAKNRKKLAGRHFLSPEVVAIVSHLPDVASARQTVYWTAPRNPDNRVLVIEAGQPDCDAEIIEKLYRLPAHVRAKFRKITEQKIAKFEQELPQLRSEAFDSIVGEPNSA